MTYCHLLSKLTNSFSSCLSTQLCAVRSVFFFFFRKLPHRQSLETQQPGEQLRLPCTDVPISLKPFFWHQLRLVEHFRIDEYAQCQILTQNSPRQVIILFVTHLFFFNCTSSCKWQTWRTVSGYGCGFQSYCVNRLIESVSRQGSLVALSGFVL